MKKPGSKWNKRWIGWNNFRQKTESLVDFLSKACYCIHIDGNRLPILFFYAGKIPSDNYKEFFILVQEKITIADLRQMSSFALARFILGSREQRNFTQMVVATTVLHLRGSLQLSTPDPLDPKFALGN